MPGWFLLTAAAAYGLVLGSFLNVVIYRLPRGMSIVRPRSHCPACGRMVRWYDNVPILSYLALRGRCRSCGAPISPRYPLVEATTGCLLVLAAWRFGVTIEGGLAAVFLLLLLPLALIDLEHQILPDVLTLPGIALGLLGGALSARVPLWNSIAGALLGAAVPYLVIVAYRLLRGVEGMGLGDVKLLAMIGAFLGWQGVLLTLCIGAVAGAAVGLVLIAARRGRLDTELPFGTFLAAAGALVLFAGGPIMVMLGWIAP